MNKKAIIGGVVAVLLVVVGVAAYWGVTAYQQEQEAKAISEFNQSVDSAKQALMKELDGYSFEDGAAETPTGEAEGPLAWIAELDAWAEKLDKDALTYHDGSTAAYDAVKDAADGKVKTALDWCAERYEAQAAGYEAYDAAAATKDELNAKIAELDAFKATAVEEYAVEPKLWEDQKAFDAWAARMDAARVAMTDAVAKIEEEEAAAEAEAAAQAQAAAEAAASANYGNSGANSGYSNNSNGYASNSGDSSSGSGGGNSSGGSPGGWVIDTGGKYDDMDGHNRPPDRIDPDGTPHWD